MVIAAELACAGSQSGNDSSWQVDTEATTLSSSAHRRIGASAHRPRAMFVLFAPAGDGCWRIVAASFSPMARASTDQELLIVDADGNAVAVAFENRGSVAWCYDDPAKNRAGYNSCFSSLVERRLSAGWLGSMLTAGKTPGGDHLLGVSGVRVRLLLQSVPNFAEALREAVDRERARLDAQRSQLARDREAAERERQAALAAQVAADRRAREERVNQEQADQERAKQASATARRNAVHWRRSLAEGAMTHCGLLVEKKQSIAKVQTIIGEYWLRIDQLYPPDVVACRFVNRQYIDPDNP